MPTNKQELQGEVETLIKESILSEERKAELLARLRDLREDQLERLRHFLQVGILTILAQDVADRAAEAGDVEELKEINRLIGGALAKFRRLKEEIDGFIELRDIGRSLSEPEHE